MSKCSGRDPFDRLLIFFPARLFMSLWVLVKAVYICMLLEVNCLASPVQFKLQTGPLARLAAIITTSAHGGVTHGRAACQERTTPPSTTILNPSFSQPSPYPAYST